MATLTATAELGTGKISKLLWSYALPSIIAMVASSLYNIVDSIFIGHGVGPLAISALALTLPLMNLAAAFGSMVGAGAAAVTSIKLGQDDHESAKFILGNTVLLNVILGASFSVVCLIFLDPILNMFGASPDTMGYAKDFMSIILTGNIVTHVYLGLNNIMRATGYPRNSMIIIITAVLANCVLDALFIFVFDWGIKGAAWATVIAQVIALGMELAHFFNKKYDIHFERWIFRLRSSIIKSIFSIGMAPFLMNVTASVVVIFINNALKATGGDMAIGAYGIVNRVALVLLMVVFGLCQGMQPVVGYNFGAQKYGRVRETFKLAVVTAMSICMFGFLMSIIFPRAIATAFTIDPTLLDEAAQGLRIVFLAYPIVGFQMVTTNFFQSIGNAKTAIFLSLTRQLIFLLPLMLILSPILGSKGVWISMPISDAAATIMAFILLRRQFIKFRKLYPGM